MLRLARSRLDRVAEYCAVGEETLIRLSYPRRTLSATIPLRRDDGDLMMLKAWRCQFNDLLGPTKGGIRFHPGVNIDEVMTLAFWMTLKTALAGLPYGGAKGGVQVDVTDFSTMELERLSRGYVAAFASILGPDTDIPAPDMYTNAMTMAWMSDEYSRTGRGNPLATFTGKPVSRGGSEGRSGATAQGAYYTFNRLREELDLGDENLRVAVQGFGNAGRKFCELMSADGHRIVAVSDSSGAVFNDDGLNVEKLAEAKRQEGSVTAFSGSGIQTRNADELLKLDVDLLVPAAIPNVINAETVGSVAAKAILEIANGPVHPEADTSLSDRSVAVIPDLLANAGGVIVSYFEWVQNRTGDYWSADTVKDRLEKRINASADAMHRASRDHDLDLRDAANLVALQRLSKASQSLGTQVDYT